MGPAGSQTPASGRAAVKSGAGTNSNSAANVDSDDEWAFESSPSSNDDVTSTASESITFCPVNRSDDESDPLAAGGIQWNTPQRDTNDTPHWIERMRQTFQTIDYTDTWEQPFYVPLRIWDKAISTEIATIVDEEHTCRIMPGDASKFVILHFVYTWIDYFDAVTPPTTDMWIRLMPLEAVCEECHYLEPLRHFDLENGRKIIYRTNAYLWNPDYRDPLPSTWMCRECAREEHQPTQADEIAHPPQHDDQILRPPVSAAPNRNARIPVTSWKAPPPSYPHSLRQSESLVTPFQPCHSQSTIQEPANLEEPVQQHPQSRPANF
jgi:hypothetical protein